jgi:hypothetical protein
MVTIRIVKGMTNMNTTIKKFISSLVSNYAEYNKIDGFYSVDISRLPESELEDFSSLIMQKDKAWACEATGLDNPAYENSMLPALNLYLSNPSKDNEIEYLNKWRKGVSVYFKQAFIENIFMELDHFNMEHSICAA